MVRLPQSTALMTPGSLPWGTEKTSHPATAAGPQTAVRDCQSDFQCQHRRRWGRGETQTQVNQRAPGHCVTLYIGCISRWSQAQFNNCACCSSTGGREAGSPHVPQRLRQPSGLLTGVGLPLSCGELLHSLPAVLTLLWMFPFSRLMLLPDTTLTSSLTAMVHLLHSPYTPLPCPSPELLQVYPCTQLLPSWCPGQSPESATAVFLAVLTAAKHSWT